MSLEYELTQLKNFNLIKYTNHYALTIDRGMGKPLIFQADNLEDILHQLLNSEEL